MKMMKRILALSLALVLTVSLMPNALQVKASTGAEATAPVVIWEDSFELDETFESVDTQNTPTTSDQDAHWNIAAPTAENKFFVLDWLEGSVTVSGGIGDAYDGESCIKLDAGSEKGRLYLNYGAKAAATGGLFSLENGGEYVASVWVKFDTSSIMTFQLMVKNVGDASNPKMTLKSADVKANEWTQVFLPFTYDSSKSCEIDMEMLSVTQGAVYLDKLQILKAEDATGIVLDKTAVALEPDESMQLTAGLNPATATTKVEYTWDSEDDSIATVDQTGKVTAVSDGTATITATATVWEFNYASNVRAWVKTETKWTAECEVTVASRSPIVVWEDSFEVGEGGTFTENSVQNTATTTDGLPNWNGAEANTANYWKADMQAGSVIISGGVGSDEGVAPKHGNSCISLSNAPDSTNAKNIVYFNYNLYNVINANNLQLKDNQMYVLSVWVKYAADTSYTTKIMVKGMQTFTLADGETTSTANPYDTNNTNKTTEWTKVEVPFMYNSSKTNILVDLEMQGNTATGTVYFDLLQITEMVDATGIVLDSTAATLAPEDTLQLTPGFEPATATTKVTYTWSSNNEAVATVDSTGKVTAVSEGEATITATAQVYEYNFDNNVRKWEAKTGEGATLTATCTVTVNDLFTIDGACVNLGEDLDMKFFVKAEDMPEGTDGFTATIKRTYADDRADHVLTNVALSTYSDGDYYVTYSGIVAKEMGDEITVTIYDSEGNQVSKVWSDSVAKLAYRAINDNATPENERNTFVALLNYGAAAQNTFNYDKTNLVNADLSPEQKTVAAYTGADVSVGDVSAELRLNESIMLKSFFETDVLDNATSIKVSFTNYRGTPVEYTVSSFGQDAGDSAYKYVPVTGLVIADVDTIITITIENAEGTITVQDSMASYVARAKAANDNDPLYDAIMALGAAAKTYLLNK